jgi:hypothetical protein
LLAQGQEGPVEEEADSTSTVCLVVIVADIPYAWRVVEVHTFLKEAVPPEMDMVELR